MAGTCRQRGRPYALRTLVSWHGGASWWALCEANNACTLGGDVQLISMQLVCAHSLRDMWAQLQTRCAQPICALHFCNSINHGTPMLAGPKGELAMLPAFTELAMLLPDHQLHIQFIGPDIPEHLHHQTCRIADQGAGPQPQQARGE